MKTKNEISMYSLKLLKELNVNTLVIHKKLKFFGIGCVSKLFSKKVKVNFGLDGTMLCDPKNLQLVNVSKCKTISFNEFRSRILNDKSKLDYCIVGNELKHYVGIGWTTSRVINLQDLKTYPRVI